MLWRQEELQFTEKCPHRHTNSPLLDLPIRQLMGDAHQLPQPALSQTPGRRRAGIIVIRQGCLRPRQRPVRGCPSAHPRLVQGAEVLVVWEELL